MTDERKPKVLMLDDERFLLEIYKLKFENSGFAVSAFYSADDALDALQKGYDPDVILFDITMPDGMSGYEFLDRVRKEKLSPHSVKIALTNEGQDGEIARTAELGADAHLLKANFTPAELAGAVAAILESRKNRPWWKKLP